MFVCVCVYKKTKRKGKYIEEKKKHNCCVKHIHSINTVVVLLVDFNQSPFLNTKIQEKCVSIQVLR